MIWEHDLGCLIVYEIDCHMIRSTVLDDNGVNMYES